MLELAEIFISTSRLLQHPECMNSLCVLWDKNQGARALWIGIRVARANGDQLGQQVLVNQLRALFPESQEYQRYLQLQHSTEAVWK